MFVRFFARFSCKKGVEIISVPFKMTSKLEKHMLFQHVQFKCFKKHVFFQCFLAKEASVSQSVPDRALGKLAEDAEDLSQRKLFDRAGLREPS